MSKAPTRMSKASVKTIEAKGYGTEPEPNTDYENSTAIVYQQDLYWYTRFVDISDGLEILIAELKSRGYSAADIAALKRNHRLIIPTIYSQACMLQKGCTLPMASEAWFKEKVRINIKQGHLIKEQQESVAGTNVISIVERTENKAREMVEDINDALDQEEVVFFKLFESMGIKPGHTKVILEHFNRIRADLNDNIDEDCKFLDRSEAAAKRKTYKARIEKYDALITALETWKNNKQDLKEKPLRETRKAKLRKAMTAVKKGIGVVDKLQFKANDNDTGLISVKPNKILNASVVVLFNTKYNVLTVLHAKNHDGLNVKGTTITNYDESTSKSIRAGRSIAVVKSMTTSSKSAINKAVASIKGAELDLKTRTNEETVIVRVI